MTLVRERITGAPGGVGSTGRGLTHSLDCGEEGLAMQATRTCSIDGCDRPVKGLGLCRMHHLRQWRHGTPADPVRPTLGDRFWAKVDRHGPDECWPWLGFRTAEGYGHFRQQQAHRVAYELCVGEIPTGYQIDHLCRTPECVNPSHLEAVTPHVNWERSDCVSAVNSRRTECKHGHPLSGSNLYVTPTGSRRCRKCNAQRQAESAARRRARLRREAGLDHDDQEMTD